MMPDLNSGVIAVFGGSIDSGSCVIDAFLFRPLHSRFSSTAAVVNSDDGQSLLLPDAEGRVTAVRVKTP